MKRALFLGAAVVAIAFLTNVNTASADHCRRGGYGYSRGFSHHHHDYGRRRGFSRYRYSTPYYGSFYGRRGRSFYHPRNRFYGGSGIYLQGRNFSFGYRY